MQRSSCARLRSSTSPKVLIVAIALLSLSLVSPDAAPLPWVRQGRVRGAGGGLRTPMTRSSPASEARASADSATPAWGVLRPRPVPGAAAYAVSVRDDAVPAPRVRQPSQHADRA